MDISGIHYLSGKPVRVSAQDGIISRVEEVDGLLVRPDLFLAPGLIDNQVNGYSGVDFASQTLEYESLRKAAGEIWKDGVTTFLPTLVTASHEDLKRSFRILSDMVDDPFFRGSVPGFHLEGPYLSAEPGFYGCHPAMHLRKPSWKELQEYQESAGGNILQITVAPELEGAADLIKRCSRTGIIVAIGHTNASAAQINSAARYGARLSTHLGNGCANLIHRHNNPIWPQLANDMLTASIIADGHHLLPEEMKVFCRVKGFDKIILTSDVTYLIGMPPGNYNYMGSMILKTNDGLIRNPELNCLAGASMPLKKGIETIASVTGRTLDEAINMASRNVARVLGLDDRGVIEEGKRADLILFRSDRNSVIIEKTFIKGEIVFSR